MEKASKVFAILRDTSELEHEIRLAEREFFASLNSQNMTEETSELLDLIPALRAKIQNEGIIQHQYHKFNLLEHTRRVIEALKESSAYRALNEDKQNDLLLAGLLHDIGKATFKNHHEAYVDHGHGDKSLKIAEEVISFLGLSQGRREYILRLMELKEIMTEGKHWFSDKEELGKIARLASSHELLEMAIIFGMSDSKAVSDSLDWWNNEHFKYGISPKVLTEKLSERIQAYLRWETAYQNQNTPWNLNCSAPPLANFTNFPRGKTAVIGCGYGHDAALFADTSFEVIGFDISDSAISQARELYPAINFQQADIFNLLPEYKAHFDYIIEHTLFCAISPGQRKNYVEAVHSILKPGGKLLGVFWAHERSGGPPFGISTAEIIELFKERFKIIRLEPCLNSISERQGEEFLAEFEASQI